MVEREKDLSSDQISDVWAKDGSNKSLIFLFMDGTTRVVNSVDYYALHDTYVAMLLHGTREYVPFTNVKAFQVLDL